MVGVIGVAAFLTAITKLNSPPFDACTQIPDPDPAIEATLLEQPNVNLTRYRLRVTQDGTPLRKARVCMRSDMGGAGGMSGMGLNEMAKEVAPGVYEVPVRFIMGGFWQSTVVVEPKPGAKLVGVPMGFEVQTEA